VDTVRDLGRVEPWQESLERSRARRNEARRASVGREHPRPVSRPAPRPAPRPASRGPATDRSRTRRQSVDRPRARCRKPTRGRILARRGGAILALTLPGVVLLSALTGGGTQQPPIAAGPPSLPAAADLRYQDAGGAGPLSRWPVSQAIEAGLTRACQPTSAPGSYVNPLGGAHVKPERIDQGVDYAGSGALAAIGTGRVTYVATSGTGWPGSFIEYRLEDGADAGCYVYYAEGVNPVAGLRVGEIVVAGQSIAQIIPGWPTGIELGWGAGVSSATYAAETHQWSATSDQDSVPTAAGKSFSALIAADGGPPGKVEG
jgi:hypothetical protein